MIIVSSLPAAMMAKFVSGIWLRIGNRFALDFFFKPLSNFNLFHQKDYTSQSTVWPFIGGVVSRQWQATGRFLSLRQLFRVWV